MRLLFEALGLVAVLAGAIAQRSLYRGVESGLLELAFVAVLLPVIVRVGERLRPASVSPWWDHGVALGVVVMGLVAFIVYPLPRVSVALLGVSIAVRLAGVIDARVPIPGGPWTVVAWLAAVVGATAQRALHGGVERGLLELVLALALLPAVARAATRWDLSIPLVYDRALAVAAAAFALTAVFVYPLPRELAGVLVASAAVLRAVTRAGFRRALVRLMPVVAAAAVLLAALDHLIEMTAPIGFDSALYILNGRELLGGLAPYRDTHLSKPPALLIPNTIYALLGAGPIAPQAVSLLCVLATGAILAWAPAVRNDPAHVRLAVFAAAVGVLGLDSYRRGGNVPETYGTPVLALAWARLATPGRTTPWDLVIGGAALGALPWIKQTLVVYALAGLALVVLAELWRGPSEGRGVRLLAAPAAAVGVAAVCATPFLATGLFGPMVDSAFLYWTRLPLTLKNQVGLWERLLRIVFLPAWPVFLVGGLALLIAAKKIAARAADRPLASWAALALLTAALQLIQHRTFVSGWTYVLPASVPLALAPWVVLRHGGRPAESVGIWAALVLLLGATCGLALGELARVPARLADIHERRATLDRIVVAADREPPPRSVPLLTLAMHPELYLSSARRCADPRLSTSLLLAQEVEFHGDDGRRRVRELLETRPVILFQDGSGENALLDSVFPEWRAELAGYERERVGPDLWVFRWPR